MKHRTWFYAFAVVLALALALGQRLGFASGVLLDELLRGFVAERRMKLVGEYRPSYRIV